MKKFINDPRNLTQELLEGFAIAHPHLIALKSEKIVCRARPKPASKVALVTLGGAGHEPALSGFVGEGMLDYSVVGDIFAAPGPPRVIEALRLAKRQAGILFVVLNHAGDVLSANMAREMAHKEGINYKMLLTHEDIAPGANAPFTLPATCGSEQWPEQLDDLLDQRIDLRLIRSVGDPVVGVRPRTCPGSPAPSG